MKRRTMIHLSVIQTARNMGNLGGSIHFQRLHRVDEFEGTGICLSNVYRVITRHGGRTCDNGELEQGVTFSFSIPEI